VKKKFSVTARRLCRTEEGATMVEYAFMLLLIALVCVGAVTYIGTASNTSFANIAASL
jgi:pilus assembly protein Flp/PilA